MTHQFRSDWTARVGVNNDPAEVDGWVAWLDLAGWRVFLFSRRGLRLRVHAERWER